MKAVIITCNEVEMGICSLHERLHNTHPFFVKTAHGMSYSLGPEDFVEYQHIHYDFEDLSISDIETRTEDLGFRFILLKNK